MHAVEIFFISAFILCVSKSIAFAQTDYPIELSSSTKANSVCGTASNTEKVVVAGGSLTEIMYFLGLQKKIVALIVTSSFPIEAKKFPSIGYVRALSTEGVLSLEPKKITRPEDFFDKDLFKLVYGLQMSFDEKLMKIFYF